MRLPARARVLLVLMIIAAAALPIVLYWQLFGGGPAVTPHEARQRLSQPGSKALLVDVSSPEAYKASHLVGAANWPYHDIMALSSTGQLPQQFRGRPLLLICRSGLSSALATRRLRQLGMPDVTNVRGGMQAWVADAEPAGPAAYTTLRKVSGETVGPPFRESPPLEQWAAVLSGFAIKPTYMLLSLLLIVVLWRSVHVELVALRWGLTFFLIGETACAVNYFAFADQSYLTEFVHSFGMVLCFGFATYAFLEGVDRRLIRYSDPQQRCAALGLCRQCIKQADVPCRLRQLFYVLIPAHIILAFMPLLAPIGSGLAGLETPSYNTRIFGAFYNYSHPAIYQLYELRFLPVVAIALMGASLAVLLLNRSDPVRWSKFLFAAGMGPLGFSLLRLFIYAPYRQNQVWFTFWEEVTELMFVVGAGAVLWLFRRGLFAGEGAPGETDRATETA